MIRYFAPRLGCLAAKLQHLSPPKLTGATLTVLVLITVLVFLLVLVTVLRLGQHHLMPVPPLFLPLGRGATATPAGQTGQRWRAKRAWSVGRSETEISSSLVKKTDSVSTRVSGSSAGCSSYERAAFFLAVTVLILVTVLTGLLVTVLTLRSAAAQQHPCDGGRGDGFRSAIFGASGTVRGGRTPFPTVRPPPKHTCNPHSFVSIKEFAVSCGSRSTPKAPVRRGALTRMRQPSTKKRRSPPPIGARARPPRWPR